ncbi:hypothetical protein ACGFWD_39415 [Streptomyces sp. NPDC048448]|uniref:hypothetical protein n=1 Tax=unclassified Streptomyces TaxID=2593676 RepID=UPI003448B133
MRQRACAPARRGPGPSPHLGLDGIAPLKQGRFGRFPGAGTLFVVCRAILLWIVILSALATAFLVGVVLGITWRVLARPFRSRSEAARQPADAREYREAA